MVLISNKKKEVKIEQLYTVKELNKILKISVGQIYLYLKSGKLQGIKIANKSKESHWRISETALNTFLGLNKCNYLHSTIFKDEIFDYCNLFERSIDPTICNTCKEKVHSNS